MQFNHPDTYLYHYTTLDSMIKIVESGILKFGALPRMNDITEAAKEIYLDGDPKDIEWNNLDILRQRLNYIGQISLSQDALFPGYALHAMWGHYAECGEGCCIVFDKAKIIDEANRNALYHGTVFYDGAIDRIIIPGNQVVSDYISSNYESLFFHKRIEWKYEQEYRIIKLNCDHSVFNGLKISDSTVAVIFHSNCVHSVFEIPKVQNCLDIIGDNIRTLEYHYSSMWGNHQNNMLFDKDGENLLDGD